LSNKLVQILIGNVYRLFDINKNLKNERIEWGCKGCYSATRKDNITYSGWCKHDKGGCACPAESKARVDSEKCPFGVWGNGWISLDNLDKHNKENNFTPSKEYLDKRKSREQNDEKTK